MWNATVGQRSRPRPCYAQLLGTHLMMLGTSFSVMIFWEGLGMAKELCRRTFWVALKATMPLLP